jgi:hypothetical protein
MNAALITMIAITFLLIIGLTIFILVVAFKNKAPQDTSTNLNLDYTMDTTPNSSVSRINWTENTRGFNSTVFPPCYDQSSEVKKIFSILKGYNLEKKYMTLLDVYSIILCQENQVKSKNCSDTFINDRLADINTYGGNANSQNASLIVKSTTNLQNTKMGKLLVMATDLIEKQMKELQADNVISKSDKEQISGYNSLFYRQHFDLMNKRCP